MDINTPAILHMLSRGVIRLNDTQLPGQTVSVKALIHKSMAEITRNQQLHAQRAVRYIRGLDDSFLSHNVIPIQSGILMKTIKSMYKIDSEDYDNMYNTNTRHQVSNSSEDINPGDGEEDEEAEIDSGLAISTDLDGKIAYYSQVEDYIFRPGELTHYTFYNFCRFFKVVTKVHAKYKTHVFNFTAQHRQFKSHCIVFRDKDGHGSDALTTVPSIMGTKVPRKSTSSVYKLFCLAHFKPFGIGLPLIADRNAISDEFERWEFSPFAQRVMSNWEALYDCKDERDADRLKNMSAKGSSTRDVSFGSNLETDDTAFAVDSGDVRFNAESFNLWSALDNGGWFNDQGDIHAPKAMLLPGVISDRELKTLKKMREGRNSKAGRKLYQNKANRGDCRQRTHCVGNGCR